MAKERDWLFWFMGETVDFIWEQTGDLVWGTVWIVAGDDAWEYVRESINDTAEDIWDVLSWDLTDDDDSKWPIPKVARVVLPLWTPISKALKSDD